MDKKSITKDERFLITLYQSALLLNEEDPEDAELDPYKIGDKINMAEKGVNATVHQLVRANFARKHKNLLISITHTGIKVALSILE